MNAPFSTEINRREMLRRCTAGFGTLGLAGLLGRTFGPVRIAGGLLQRLNPIAAA